MKTFVIFFIVLAVLDMCYEGIRFALHVRVSTGLVAKARPFMRTEGVHSMLVVGDSTAVGVGVSEARFTVAGRLSELLDASVENYAKSGAVTAEIPQQISQAQKSHYDMILIQVGANDVIHLHAIETTAQSLDAVLSAARKLSDHVILITAGKIGKAPLFPWFIGPFITYRAGEMREAFMRTAAEHAVVYVDLFSKPDPFNADPRRYYAPDGLHLSDDGYGFWYQMTKAAIDVQWPGFVHG